MDHPGIEKKLFRQRGFTGIRVADDGKGAPLLAGLFDSFFLRHKLYKLEFGLVYQVKPKRTMNIRANPFPSNEKRRLFY